MMAKVWMAKLGSWLCVLAALLLGAAGARAASPLPPSGLWDGKLTVGTVEIPFRFELALQRGDAKLAFFNGDERVRSSAGSFGPEGLAVQFAFYASALRATWTEGALVGTYARPGTSYMFRGTPHVSDVEAAGKAPAISGQWEIAVQSPKGESAWRFFVRQSGARVSASILRVDGDTGALEGRFTGDKFVLSHFSGARPLLLELTLKDDGSLVVVENGKKTYNAVKTAQARARNLPEPADPARWTRVKDPSQPLRFKGRTLDGSEVTESDPRFRGKVVLVNVMGSWCPNCHDEAPFLAELDRKYRKRGLQVVALSFEEDEQLRDPTRLRAFVKEYGIEYSVLIGGAPSELASVLPQADHLNTWPATFFVGRDGLVRGAHAGFASKATGAAHAALREELTATVERLLAEKPRTERDGEPPR